MYSPSNGFMYIDMFLYIFYSLTPLPLKKKTATLPLQILELKFSVTGNDKKQASHCSDCFSHLDFPSLTPTVTLLMHGGVKFSLAQFFST